MSVFSLKLEPEKNGEAVDPLKLLDRHNLNISCAHCVQMLGNE